MQRKGYQFVWKIMHFGSRVWHFLESRLLRGCSYIWEFIKYYSLYPFAMLKYRKRKIYLLAERGTDARDNGYHMYRYIRQNHPELEAYYVITQDSADREKVLPYGNVVKHGSLQHYLLFIAAKYKISTHIAGYSPYIYFYTKYVNKLHWHGKKIFLQHGVTPYDLPQLYREKTDVALFICGAKPEFDYLSEKFHYDDQLKYTGFARYDALHDIVLKKQILIMPTWRQFLAGQSDETLAQSQYVKTWNAVLQDPKLIAETKQAGLQIVFYPHYELQKKLHLFTAGDDSVVIADFAHYDVQQLLKESQLLVTDYSSVYFDFAYMKKPCIYYQFDVQRFFSEHYAKGYFDYETMGFGEVVHTHDQLVELLIGYIRQNFAMKELFVKRIDGFFVLHDQENCQRIMEEIQKL